MTKDTWSGLVPMREAVEWATLQRTREGIATTDGGREAVPPSPEKAAPGAASALVEVLKPLAPRLKGSVSLGLLSEQVLLRVLRLPAVDAEEIKGMVDFQAEKLSPFPLDTMVVGHEVLHAGTDSSLVLVAAVRTDVVDKLGAEVRAGGLEPVRVDAAVLGSWRMLRDGPGATAEGCQVHLSLVMPAPQIVVVRHGVPLVFRTLSIDLDGPSAALEMAREISFTLMSLELEHGPLESPHLVVWTGAELGPEWLEALQTASSGPLRVEDLHALPSAAEGLARRALEGGALDLTPPSWIAARARGAFRRLLITAVAAVAGVWLLLVAAALGVFYLEKLNLAKTRAEREAVRPGALAVRDMRRRVFTIQRYLDRSGSVLECLREVSTLLPPDTELTSFSFYKGEELKLSGESATVDGVYDFKSRLDGSSVLREAALQGPRQAQNGRQLFDLTMHLAGENPP